MEKEKRKKSRSMIVGVILLLVLLIAISYAWLTLSVQGNKRQVLRVGSLRLILNESGNAIQMEKASPLTDEEGLASDGFTFQLENKGKKVDYTIYLDDSEIDASDTRIDDRYMKYSLEKNGVSSGAIALTSIGVNPNRVLDSGSIGKGVTNTYTLRIWITNDIDGEISNQLFKAKLRVEVEESIEPNAPELATNMIPVKYNGTSWVKADTSDTWYNYDNQEWANAVTVSEATRSNYLSADANTPIAMNDINTMWVWIPRYSYTIGSEDGTDYYGKQGQYLDTAPTQALPGEIDVKFIPTSTKEIGSAQYKVSEGISGWRTPDGFTFGDKELPGVWVAKFETSNQEGTYESNDSNLTPIVKPEVTSWRKLKISTMETVAMHVTKENNIYGLSANEVDSHMMKNSEWSLAAYLSQSRYGKLGNRSYTGANKEIYNNNYTGYKTGCSAGVPSPSSSDTCSFEYDNLTDRGSGTGSAGGGASTTGNIYGIYDMNGGASEYVMGNYNNYSGYDTNMNSGYSGPTGNDNGTFNGIPFPDSKYYDLYTTDDVNTACNGKACTSHALSEVATRWYRDFASMVTSGSPWLGRGGSWLNSSGAGVFGFYLYYGLGDYSLSFRLVLTP